MDYLCFIYFYGLFEWICVQIFKGPVRFRKWSDKTRIRWYRSGRFIMSSEIHYRPARYDKMRRHRVVATRTTTCITHNRVTDTVRRRSDLLSSFPIHCSNSLSVNTRCTRNKLIPYVRQSALGGGFLNFIFFVWFWKINVKNTANLMNRPCFVVERVSNPTDTVRYDTKNKTQTPLFNFNYWMRCSEKTSVYRCE